jgi:hypothetical protein
MSNGLDTLSIRALDTGPFSRFPEPIVNLRLGQSCQSLQHFIRLIWNVAKFIPRFSKDISRNKYYLLCIRDTYVTLASAM